MLIIQKITGGENNRMKKRVTITFIAAMVMAVGLTACQKADDGKGTIPDAKQKGTEKEIVPDEELDSDEGLASNEELDSDEGLDVVEPDPADDDWYMKGNIYTDENGNRVEVFFDDYGMIEIAVNGLSLYYTAVDKVQIENNWRGYPCDDGTWIVYYPGEPAHLEISDGEYAGLYEAGGDKVK